MQLRELEERIEEARHRRNMLESRVNSLRSCIYYHRKRGNHGKVRLLSERLREVYEKYRRARDEYWQLVEEWRELRRRG